MISIKNISKSYQDNIVIRDFSLNIKKNKTTILMGTSGCGKTTIANILLGLITPDSGKIEGMVGKKLSAVFQEDRLSMKLSAIANIRLVVDKTISKEEIIRQFSLIDLSEKELVKPVSILSGGQRRRVAIMRAMLVDGDFYCLDEPFRALDKLTKEKTMKFVKEKTKNKTVLLITHDLEEAKFFNADCINLNKEKYRKHFPSCSLDSLAIN